MTTPTNLFRYNPFTHNFDLAQVTNCTDGPSGVPIAPLQYVADFDDFLNFGSDVSDSIGKLNWTAPFGAWVGENGTQDNPGIIKVNSGVVFAPYFDAMILSEIAANKLPFLLGGGDLMINFLVDLTALSTNTDNYNFFCGLTSIASDFAGTEPVDGCYFRYNHAVNSGKFQIECADNSTRTTLNTNYTAVTGFLNFQVVINADASTATFYINATNVGTISTNITKTKALGPSVSYYLTVGSIPEIKIDLFYYYQALTNKRPGQSMYWPSGSGSGSGDVVGPALSTDNAIARFNGTDGKKIQNSLVLVDDSGNMTGVNALTTSGQMLVGGKIVMNKGQAVNVTTPSAYPYNVLSTDYLVKTDTTAARSIVLPAVVAGQYNAFVIKDITGTAGANNITITALGGATIDGAASYSMNVNFGSITVVSDGTAYFII